MNLLIRKMKVEDVPAAHALDVLSFSLPWSERSLRFEVTDNPAARCWIAEIDNRLAGMLILWLIVDEAHIATIATHPQFRRMGVGSQLLENALQSALAEGARKAVLEVRAGNLAAQAMYQKFGFVEDGRRPRYYKDNHEDAVLMSLDLANLPKVE
ncbi:MAG: ribosomal protein S18-alanine N-acetyltransferase [Anaerolineales bacterium]